MEGHKPQPPLIVQRAFAQTRLSDDLLAQAYEHVLHSVQPVSTTQETHATRPTRCRKRMSRVTATGGRKS
jgi:hypothetical protein